MKRILFSSLIALAVICCKEQDQDSPEKYVDVEGIDTSIKPGDNFFGYVNATWYDTAKIADDQVGVGSYSFLNIPQKILLQNILEEVSNSTNPIGSIEQQVGDFYAAGKTLLRSISGGLNPLNPYWPGSMKFMIFLP
ncbi:MAG: M13 family metallopeptidase [Cyclobacteriaceae bacterium]|nr:M13 family metallopeptidase [Cyclobacteriaceae bacterium]